MKGAILGILLGMLFNMLFVVLPEIREQGKETRRLALELANMNRTARSRGPLHEYLVNLDNDLCVTNVVDDGKVVWQR